MLSLIRTISSGGMLPPSPHMPKPMSLVALPPRPIIILRAPALAAARIISPSPKVSLFNGSLSSSLSKVNPLHRAISIKAHFSPSLRKSSRGALRGLRSGSQHSTSINCTSDEESFESASYITSNDPSPPSAIGIFSISRSEMCTIRILMASSIAFAT